MFWQLGIVKEKQFTDYRKDSKLPTTPSPLTLPTNLAYSPRLRPHSPGRGPSSPILTKSKTFYRSSKRHSNSFLTQTQNRLSSYLTLHCRHESSSSIFPMSPIHYTCRGKPQQMPRADYVRARSKSTSGSWRTREWKKAIPSLNVEIGTDGCASARRSEHAAMSWTASRKLAACGGKGCAKDWAWLVRRLESALLYCVWPVMHRVGLLLSLVRGAIHTFEEFIVGFR
jgi:hypothetical protein